jgi:hypothetical protein
MTIQHDAWAKYLAKYTYHALPPGKQSACDTCCSGTDPPDQQQQQQQQQLSRTTSWQPGMLANMQQRLQQLLAAAQAQPSQQKPGSGSAQPIFYVMGGQAESPGR